MRRLQSFFLTSTNRLFSKLLLCPSQGHTSLKTFHREIRCKLHNVLFHGFLYTAKQGKHELWLVPDETAFHQSQCNLHNFSYMRRNPRNMRHKEVLLAFPQIQFRNPLAGSWSVSSHNCYFKSAVQSISPFRHLYKLPLYKDSGN